jgi:hypothetical protein
MNAAAFTTDPRELIRMASKALLAQHPVAMVLPAGWERPRGFPLPIKATPNSNVREYRPLAVLEWVNDQLSGASTEGVTS